MHDRRLVEMLEAENTAKRLLVDPKVSEFRIPFGFFPEQIGMQSCMVGPDGRIWRSSDRGRVFTLIYDPAQFNRLAEMVKALQEKAP